MQISNRTLILSIVFVVIVLCGGAALFLFFFRSMSGSAPAAGAVPTESVLPGATASSPSALPTSLPEPTGIPAIPESRRLTLEYPSRMRAGNSDLVRLTLEVDNLGNITPTAQVNGNNVTGETIEIPKSL